GGRAGEGGQSGGGFPAGTRKACDNAGVDRIAAEAEHHRNRRGRHWRGAGRGTASDDQIDPRAQQLLDQGGEPAVIPPGVTDLDDEVAALAIAERAHPREETLQSVVGRGTCRQIPDTRRLSARLRARRERPGRCTAEQRDELAAFHSTTSSARPDSGSGTVMPSALAVWRFRNSSTFV